MPTGNIHSRNSFLKLIDFQSNLPMLQAITSNPSLPESSEFYICKVFPTELPQNFKTSHHNANDEVDKYQNQNYCFLQKSKYEKASFGCFLLKLLFLLSR